MKESFPEPKQLVFASLLLWSTHIRMEAHLFSF
jgi:hypothetical protein